MRLPIPKDLVINFGGMIFLGVCGFLAWENGAFAALFSPKGVAFVLVGVIVAGVLIGWPLAAVHRWFCRKQIDRANGDLGERAMQIIRYTGTLSMLAQLLLIYYLTSLAFTRWILTGAE